MKIEVIKKYTSEFPNPLNLEMNETVNIDHTKNNFPGWKFCISKDNKGWIPESYLKSALQLIALASVCKL